MESLSQKARIQTQLLRWFEKNRRDLPWRKTGDPYAVWVSEIMLQQTQVATVIPYYQEFLKSFPTVLQLAKADLSKVLKVWEGLGYYSRARNLHQASQIVLNRFHGKIPNHLEGLLSLPGIGRSTAGAILSFAYHQDAPILDGNAKRVLSRLFAISESQGERKTEQLLWRISQSLIPKGFSNPFNQALMDLGSMICVPKEPRCSECPLRDVCKGRTSGDPRRYPSKRRKRAIPHRMAVSAVIKKNGRVLLNQRPPRGLLGGLWEFPNWEIDGEKRWRVRNVIKKEMGINAKVKQSIGTFRQTYSHFKLTMQVFDCKHLNGKRKGKWVPIQDLHLFPMSRIHRRIAQMISAETRG
jgi:A/G-specific adenine glycosylase